VDFIAGAVEETGIDENHPVRSGTDRGLQVDGGAALLVHETATRLHKRSRSSPGVSRGRADPRQADVAAVSRQINLALFYDAQLDIGAV
jgi:hypothetical protein